MENEGVRMGGPDEIQRKSRFVTGSVIIDIDVGGRADLRQQNFADAVGLHLLRVDGDVRYGCCVRGGDVQNV